MIETKVDARQLSGGYEQAGLLVYVDDDNYIKYDLISDDGQTVKNRIELRSEVDGAIQDPQPQRDRRLNADAAVWLRLTKTGTATRASTRSTATTWTAIGQPVTNADGGPDVRPVHARRQQPAAARRVFDYFSRRRVDRLRGARAGEPRRR